MSWLRLPIWKKIRARESWGIYVSSASLLVEMMDSILFGWNIMVSLLASATNATKAFHCGNLDYGTCSNCMRKNTDTFSLKPQNLIRSI